MFVSDNLGVNASGNLTIGGVDTVVLAKKYGTPLYVMDEDMIRRDCKTFQKSIDTAFLISHENFSCFNGKRAVHVNREIAEFRQHVFIFDLLEIVQ